ncbi:Major Facilitator Superfamily protein [compost metagenome]
MSIFMGPRKTKKMISPNRRYLAISIMEGFPAVFVLQLLGGPFLTGYLLLLGATSSEIGFVLAITTLVNIVQIYAAVVMQKVTNRRLMLVIFGSLHRFLWTSVGLIPFLFAKEWWVLVYIILFTVAHICNAVTAVVWTSIMSDMVPAGVRGRYLGIRNTIHGAVASLALFIGGQILEYFPGEQGFNYLFIICAVASVLNTIAFAFYPNLPFETSTESSPIKMIGKPLKDSIFIKAILFLSLWLFVQGITVPLFSYVMLKLMNISYQWISIITVVHMLVMMGSYILWGNLNARYSTKTLLMWSLPIIACACLMWGTLLFLPALLVLFMVHIVLGVGLGGFNQMVFSFIIGDTPKSERPMYIATYSAITGFAGFLGPLFGGWLYESLSGYPQWVQTYGVSVAIGILLMIIGIWLGRMVLKDPDEHAMKFHIKRS